MKKPPFRLYKEKITRNETRERKIKSNIKKHCYRKFRRVRVNNTSVFVFYIFGIYDKKDKF